MPIEDTLNKIRAASVRIVEEVPGSQTPDAASSPPPRTPRLNARELVDIFRNTLPAWERDGLGLRGLVADSKLFDPDLFGTKPEPQTFSLTQNKAELDSPESISSPPAPTFNEFRFPTGCPFDLLLEIDEPDNPSSTSCTVSKSARLATFQHKECNPFPDCSGTFDLRQYASVFTQGAPKEVESGLWSFYEPDDTSQGVGLKAVTRPDKTFFSLYKNDDKQFFHSLLDQDNVSVYGYADELKYNFALAASKTQDSSFLRLFGTDAKVYASIGTEKSGPSESFVYGYAGDGDTRYKIVAKPAAASMGVWDEGSAAGDGRYVILNTEDWPTETTSPSNVRLVACSNSYKQGDPLPTLVKLREVPIGIPSGCPYDLYPALSENSSSAWAAVRHTTCVSPGVGNFDFDQYASVRVSQTANGFFAYEGTGLDGYIAAETKGQAETFVWGYADQGQSNFRARAFGSEQVIQIWSTAQDTINKLENTNSQTVLYGRYSGQFQYTTKADNQKAASIFSDTSNNGYLETATKGQAETFVWGYADQGQSNFRARAFGFDSKVEVYHNNGNYYNQMYYDTGDGGFYGFYNATSYYRVWGTQDKSELQLWKASGAEWLQATAKNGESVVYGFAASTNYAYRARATNNIAQMQIWQGSEGDGQYGTWYASNNVGLSMTKGGNDNAATLEVASGEAGIGLFLKAGNPFARLVVNGLTMYDGGTGSYLTRTTLGIETPSQAEAFVSTGGLYVHNGANYVDIKPPAGKDAFFQLTTWLSPTAILERAYVLRTPSEGLDVPQWLLDILEELARLAEALLELAAELAALALQVAAQLAELAAQFAQALADLANEVFSAISSAISALRSELMGVINELTSQVSAALGELASWITEAAAEAAQALAKATEAAQAAAQALAQIAQTLAQVASLEARVAAIENRLDSASIEANCVNGDVTVTLNL
jgi:hypothetical protein